MSNSNFITLQEAQALTHAYQDADISENQPLAIRFSADDIQALLGPTTTVGLRFYFSLTSNDELSLVVVAVDEDGKDMIEQGMLDRGDHCPTVCDDLSPLISQ